MKLPYAVLPLMMSFCVGSNSFAAVVNTESPHDVAYTLLFTLDTRDPDWSLSPLFTLDTRDFDSGTSSETFTLDTRAELPQQTHLFTLDTRGWDSLRVPTNITLNPQHLTVLQIRWDYFGSSSGFSLQRRRPLGVWETIETVSSSAREWLDRSLLAGHFYEFRIAAIHADGISDYSDVAQIQMPSYPAAPQELELGVEGESALRLSWRDMAQSEVGFEVWRKSGSAGSWLNAQTLGSNVTEWIDATVEESVVYSYRVRSFNEWGHSAFSDEVSLTTPVSGGDCGYSLVIQDVSVSLDELFVTHGSVMEVNSRALIAGSVSARITSPPGNPNPVRVVLGFRDAQGRALGQPVHLSDFYSLPGCPGLLIDTTIPDGFRAPDAGTNTLWMEIIMAQRDPLAAFVTQRHTQESPMRKKLFEVRIEDISESVSFRVLNASATLGDLVYLPVQMVSSGREQAASFSLMLESHLSHVQTLLGADVPQAMMRTTLTTNGFVGFEINMPAESPMATGSKHLLTLVCQTMLTGTTTISFVDSPVERFLTGGEADTSTATWTEGTVLIGNAGWEGDISPAEGDGKVNAKDARLAEQIVLGLKLPPDPGLTFQRMDCAPVEAGGDGLIDMADVVAIRAYASGALPLRAAWGPTETGARIAEQSKVIQSASAMTSVFFEAPAGIQRGDSFTVPVKLASQGNVHGISVSMAFDPAILAFEELSLVGSATNGLFMPNLEQVAEGIVAFCVTLPPEDVFTSGNFTLANLRLKALEGVGIATTQLSVVQSPAECIASGVNAEKITVDPLDETITVFDAVAASAPYPPTGGEAVAISMTQINVSWQAAPFSTGYRIRRRLEGETAWSLIAELNNQRTAILDNGLPPGLECEYLISSVNPDGEESAPIQLQSRTWSVIDHWRNQKFALSGSVAEAADSADPDGDGLPNLLEFQLGTDPWTFNEDTVIAAVEPVFEGTLSPTLSYSIYDGAPGRVTFEASYSLIGASNWSNLSLAPVGRRREGIAEHVKMRLHDSSFTNGAIFLRMRTE